MPDRQYTYQVKVDASTAAAAARQLRDVFERELSQVGGGTAANEQAKQQTAIVRAQTQAQVAAVRAASAEAANASKAAAAMSIEAARQETAAVQAGTQTRLALVRTEATERQQLAAQTTATIRAQAAQQEQAARTQTQTQTAQAKAAAATQIEIERQKTAAIKAQGAQIAAQARADAAAKIAEVRLAAQQETAVRRAAAQQERAEIVKGTALKKQEERERVEAAREAAYEEAQIAKRAAQQIRALQNEATAAFKQEKREQTAAAKQAAREQAAAARDAARMQTGGVTAGAAMRGALGGALGSANSMLGLAAGGFAGYAAVQVGQMAYDAGKQGAQIERTSALLDVVAQRLNVSGAGVRSAIVQGSGNTLSNSQAESLALQMLSQKWATERPDITGDAAILAEASRKFAMLYPDSEGRAQTPGDVSAKLLSYIREGNKELVDQFNINNTGIAQAAGVPNENLTAEDRARGLFKILEEEIARLPESLNSSADQIAESEAKFTDAMDRMKTAMAGPTAASADFIAQVIEGAVYGVPKEGQLAAADTAIAAQEQRKIPGFLFGPSDEDIADADEQIRRLEIMKMATNQVFEAMKQGVGGSQEYANAMAAIEESVSNTNGVTDAQLAQLIEINDWYTKAMAAGGGYAESLEEVGKAISNIVPMAEDARLSLIALAGQMAAGLQLNVGLNTANPTWQEAAELAGRTINVPGTGPVAVSPFAGTTTGETLRALGGNRTDLLPNPSAEANRQDMYDVWDLREERRREAEAAANKAARAYESAANKTQEAFERAAEEAADAFKSALEKIPGLFGTSSVTADDMADAEAGLYEEKPDEYLRQLRDEVLNGVDRPGVDLADIAGVAGIDQSLSPEAQLRLIERKWDDSSLFANPDALRFLNTDAIAKFQADQEASDAGRKNLYAYLGLGPDSPLTPEQRAKYAESTGLDADGSLAGMIPDETAVQAAARASKETFAAEFAKPVAGEGGSSGQAFLQELVGSLDADLIGGEVLETLNGIGAALLDGIKAGYDKAAATGDWSTPVVGALAEQVAPMVLAMIEDQI